MIEILPGLPVDPGRRSEGTHALALQAGLELLYCPDQRASMRESQCAHLALQAKLAEDLDDQATLVRLRPCLGCPGIRARQGRTRAPRRLEPDARETVGSREIARRLAVSHSEGQRLLAVARASGRLRVVGKDRSSPALRHAHAGGLRALYDAGEVDRWVAETKAARAAEELARRACWARADVCTVREFARARGRSVPWVAYRVQQALARGQLAPLDPRARPRRYPRRGLETACSTGAAPGDPKRLRAASKVRGATAARTSRPARGEAASGAADAVRSTR